MGSRLRTDELEQAAATLGTGPDPVAGERVLALVAHSRDHRAGCFTLLAMLNPIRFLVRRTLQVPRWDHCWMVTDSRLLIRAGGDHAEVPLDALEHARGSGAIASFFGWEFVDVAWGDGRSVHLMAPAHAHIAAFVRRIVRARGHGGWAAPRPAWPEPSADDPTGIAAARAALDVDDGRATVMLDQLEAAVGQGRADAVEALGLARRVVVFSRMVAWGRGSRGGAWVSALRPAELRAAISSAVGPFEARAALPDRPGWRVFVYEHSAADAAGRAIAESLFALVAGAGALLVAPRTDLRLCMLDQGDWTAWTLEQKAMGEWDSLSFVDGHTQHKIARRVLQAESLALTYRCVIDPRAPAAQVVAAPASETITRLQETDPTLTPSRFRAARPDTAVARLQTGRAPAGAPADAPAGPPAPAPPRAWHHAGVVNLLGGALQALLGLPILWCMGTPTAFVLIDALDALTGVVDQDLAKGVVVSGAMLASLAVLGIALAQAAVGVAQLVSPRGARVPGLVFAGIAVLGLGLGGVVGATAGLIALYLGTRPDPAA